MVLEALANVFPRFRPGANEGSNEQDQALADQGVERQALKLSLLATSLTFRRLRATV